MTRAPYPTNLEDLAHDSGGPLVCHGCGHSVGGGTFPNGPSGERPCCFCTRNVQREQWVADMPAETRAAYGKTFTAFYDNSPMKRCPMDCYISVDMVFRDVPEGAVVFG